MPLTKTCEVCGKVFEKPYTTGKPEWKRRKFCSPACKVSSQVGQPSKLKGRKSKKPSQKQYVPCRICGEPTKYNGTSRNPLVNRISCENPACREQSQEIRRQRISEKAIEMYVSGEREPTKNAWKNVSQISKEEKLLSPWLTSLGFSPQYKVLTGVHTNKLPRMFRLDFALPEKKLYIEVDGHVHRLRKERDARRDSMMDGLGWTGLRIPSKNVREDMESVKTLISQWLSDVSTSF